MHDDVKSIIFSEEDINQKVAEMGRAISEKYESVYIIAILKGSFIFLADLVRAIDKPVKVDFMVLSSYGSGTKSTGAVKILKDLDNDVTGKKLLIVEDIVDTGRTLNYLSEVLYARGAESIEICTLLDKPKSRVRMVDVDYCGFTAPDEFLVGYGLDYNEIYRNLPYIGALDTEKLNIT